jgi:hypothetical protein
MEMHSKKTTELTTVEKQGLCDLFSRVFLKTRTVEEFEKKYLSPDLGHSFHSYIHEGGRIVGAHSVIPVRYIFFGKEVLFGLNVDTMIDVRFRNFDHLFDLVRACETLVKDAGISCVVGFPNRSAYGIFQKGMDYHDIGRLNIYILPVNPNAILKKPIIPMRMYLSFLGISIGILNLFVRHKRRTVPDSPIKKVKEGRFYQNRYTWMKKDYHFLSFSEKDTAVYTVEDYENIRTAFIIDIQPGFKVVFMRAIGVILKEEKKKIDLIMYVGTRIETPLYFFRVPENHKPKDFYFTGKILIPGIIDERIFRIENWHLNLSNYDLI